MIKRYAFIHCLASRSRKSEHGQTMAEYAVVLAVITIAIIGALSFLAGGISSALSSVTNVI